MSFDLVVCNPFCASGEWPSAHSLLQEGLLRERCGGMLAASTRPDCLLHHHFFCHCQDSVSPVKPRETLFSVRAEAESGASNKQQEDMAAGCLLRLLSCLLLRISVMLHGILEIPNPKP